MIPMLATAGLSALLCGLYLVAARRGRILDQPNHRSSHVRPTPHGGGVALLLAFFLAVALAPLRYGPWEAPLPALAGGAGLLMLLGAWDDLRNLPVALRMGAYALLCIAFAWMVLPAAAMASPALAAAFVLGSGIAALWLLNLYNFMDGIDGLAASQAIVACAVAGWLAAGEGADGYARFCALLAAAHAGYLCWNWPPARLFMGDAGSVPTGFLLAGLALFGEVRGYLPVACWLILLACFIVDATWTLVWRMATGQPFLQAHRMHAYQRLSRHWSSHRKVDYLLLAIAILWLVPLAALTARWPQYDLFLVILAYLPLLFGMAKIARIK